MKSKSKFKWEFIATDGKSLIDYDHDLLSLLNRVPEDAIIYYIPEGRCIFAIKKPNADFIEETFSNECFLCEIFNPKLNIQSSYYVKSELEAVKKAVDSVRKGMEVEIWELKRRFKPKMELNGSSENSLADTDISDIGDTG